LTLIAGGREARQFLGRGGQYTDITDRWLSRLLEMNNRSPVE
jgi:hypothetical protein